VFEALLCRELGCTPTDLREEDPQRLRLIFQAIQARKSENPIASLF